MVNKQIHTWLCAVELKPLLQDPPILESVSNKADKSTWIFGFFFLKTTSERNKINLNLSNDPE